MDNQPDQLDQALTFEQQQEIDRLARLAWTPSSNSNKYRYNLYAYVDLLLLKARTEELWSADLAQEPWNGDELEEWINYRDDRTKFLEEEMKGLQK
jgi:hypothetical protein